MPSSSRDPPWRSSPQSSLSRQASASAPLGAVWACAALWSLLTALSCVLWRGSRHGDWTAFHRYELPDGKEEDFEWSARTGRYTWRRELEEQELFDQDPDAHFP